MRGPRNTITTAATLVVAAVVLTFLTLAGPVASALGAVDTTPPGGSVGGLRSPVSGALELRINAYDEGAGLAGAEAQLDGAAPVYVRLGSGECPEHPSPGTDPSPGACPESVSGVPLSLNTRSVADGERPLRVRVTDGAGNTTTLVDQDIVVRNAPPSGRGSEATVAVGISSGSAGSSGSGGKGGGKGKGQGNGGGGGVPGPPCRWPKLRMRLVAKPLWRTRPGKLPVLRFRRRYLYRGWLTCRVGGRRVLAAPGTPVQVFYRIWRRSFRKRRGPIRVKKGTIRVRPNGRLWVKLGFLSGRTIVFRYRSPGGGVARSKLRMAIARTDPPRRGQ